VDLSKKIIKFKLSIKQRIISRVISSFFFYLSLQLLRLLVAVSGAELFESEDGCAVCKVLRRELML